MSEWDEKHGAQAKMQNNDKPYKGCGEFILVLAVLVWVGGFFGGMFITGSGSALMLITWFSALISGGILLALSDIVKFLGQIEYNTRQKTQSHPDNTQ